MESITLPTSVPGVLEELPPHLLWSDMSILDLRALLPVEQGTCHDEGALVCGERDSCHDAALRVDCVECADPLEELIEDELSILISSGEVEMEDDWHDAVEMKNRNEPDGEGATTASVELEIDNVETCPAAESADSMGSTEGQPGDPLINHMHTLRERLNDLLLHLEAYGGGGRYWRSGISRP